MGIQLTPGQGLLFMKVGVHAQESLEDIIKRKTQEIRDAGVAFWGYGGNTCHPTTMVQPFAEQQAKKGQPIHLVMQKMKSKHHAAPDRAKFYSVDRINWKEVPKEINALGSHYALVLSSLYEQELILPPRRAIVPIGPSKGRHGNEYLKGQVDKACFELTHDIDIPPEPEEPQIQISLVAELAKPYAVYLK